MTNKIKPILTGIIFCGIIVSFTGCNLIKSPISMVKKFGIWQIAEDDRFRDGSYTNPKWERLIKEYDYFAKYDDSNWSKQQLGLWYLHYVNYATEFNKTITDGKMLGGFVINNKKKVSVKEALSYFKKGIKLSESRTYNGMSVIYPTENKERILNLIAELESGKVTDIAFDYGIAILRWITNKMADKDYDDDVVFVGTYIMADVSLKNSDGTNSDYGQLLFYTIPDDPIDPYRFNQPFNSY